MLAKPYAFASGVMGIHHMTMDALSTETQVLLGYTAFIIPVTISNILHNLHWTRWLLRVTSLLILFPIRKVRKDYLMTSQIGCTLTFQRVTRKGDTCVSGLGLSSGMNSGRLGTTNTQLALTWTSRANRILQMTTQNLHQTLKHSQAIVTMRHRRNVSKLAIGVACPLHLALARIAHHAVIPLAALIIRMASVLSLVGLIVASLCRFNPGG